MNKINSSTKIYTSFALNADTTKWLLSGYKKKNNLLRALTSQNKDELSVAMKEYIDALPILVGNDLQKAHDSVRYIWTQASAIMTSNNLDDWTINLLNHEYYPLLENTNNVEDTFILCEKVLMEYVRAYNEYIHNQHYSVLVKQVIYYIHETLPNNISIEQIAENLHFSTSYISHKFKEETNMTVASYIMNEKIKMAKNMINENYSLLDIAIYLNFSSQSHFTKQFKNIVGLTPNEYRKKL